MTFDLAFDLSGQIQSQWIGYRISSTNYVNTLIKMIADDSWLPWADYITMAFGLAFDLQFDLEGQMPGS